MSHFTDAVPPPPPPAEDGTPPAKRVKFQEGTAGAATVVAATVTPEALRQLRGALRKLRAHIGAPRKAAKASELLRKLLDDGSVIPEIADQAFQVLCEAMANPTQADDVELRRPIRKLVLSAEAEERVFSKAQRRQLDVWKVWAVLRPQLHTDDSFVFTKVANNVRDLVAALPELDPDEDDAFDAVQSGAWDEARRARCREMDLEDAATADAAAQAGLEAKAQAAQAAAPTEEDPFGLDAFLAEPEKPPPAEALLPAPLRGLVWSAVQCKAMRRQALLDCLNTVEAVCKHAWARSSGFQAIEAAWRRRELFCRGQQPQLQRLHDFVQTTRSTVLRGPSAAQLKQDANPFEQARKDWSTKSVSSRGKVGAAGDTKSTGWLG